MMRLRSALIAAAVACAGVAGLGQTANATPVTFSVIGTFTSSGDNTFNDGNAFITFESFLDNEYEAFEGMWTNVTFGTFYTEGTTGSPDGVADTFTLDVIQSTPDGGDFSIVGSLTGTLGFASGQAYIQFNAGDLEHVIGSVMYRITEADGGTPGRVALIPPTNQNPAGAATLEGEITLLRPPVVPEPSTLVLAGLGLPIVYLARRRMAVAR
jgi:hypothetical protein